MQHETHVTYEQAQVLKQLGFDAHCYNFFGVEPDGKPLIITSTLCNVRNSDLKGRDVTAPFLCQAQKWLREAKGIALNIIAHDGGIYQWEEVNLPNAPEYDGYITLDRKQYDTYDLALSAAITQTLKLLEERK